MTWDLLLQWQADSYGQKEIYQGLLYHLARQAHALELDTNNFPSQLQHCLCAFPPTLLNGDSNSAYRMGLLEKIIGVAC